MKPQEELFIKMVLNAWHTQVEHADDLFNSLSDKQLLNEVAPGRNGVFMFIEK